MNCPVEKIQIIKRGAKKTAIVHLPLLAKRDLSRLGSGERNVGEATTRGAERERASQQGRGEEPQGTWGNLGLYSGRGSREKVSTNLLNPKDKRIVIVAAGIIAIVAVILFRPPAGRPNPWTKPHKQIRRLCPFPKSNARTCPGPSDAGGFRPYHSAKLHAGSLRGTQSHEC